MRVIETDNHGSDYPSESFVGPELPKEICQQIADLINSVHCRDDHASRFWRVVDDNYKLQPGFEP